MGIKDDILKARKEQEFQKNLEKKLADGPFLKDMPEEKGIEEGDWLDYYMPLSGGTAKVLKAAASKMKMPLRSLFKKKDAPTVPPPKGGAVLGTKEASIRQHWEDKPGLESGIAEKQAPKPTDFTKKKIENPELDYKEMNKLDPAASEAKAKTLNYKDINAAEAKPEAPFKLVYDKNGNITKVKNK